MRKTFVALAAAAVLLFPVAAPSSQAQAQMTTPTVALAQPQAGLVNVSVDENNICALCDVAVAVQAIVQACDALDINQIQLLVVQALSANVPVQVSDCSQAAGDQELVIEQETVQQQGAGQPKPGAQNDGQAGLVNVSVDQNNICVGCDVAAAVQAVIQACDLVDLNQAQVLVVQAASLNAPVQVSDCDQEAGNQRLRIQQATEQQQG